MRVAATTFDERKLLELIVYIAKSIPDPSYHKVAKILYAADKLHLEHYGRLISGDLYRKMPDGPVPSWAYDLMKAVAGRSDVMHPVDVAAAAKAFTARDPTIEAIRDADASLFSKSELACLNKSIEERRDWTFGRLREESHDAAWRSVEDNADMPLDVIARAVPNTDEILQYLAA